jgi:hypothetical protein
MNASPHLWTARELSGIMKVTPQAVSKRLRGIPSKTRIVRGIQTAAWELQALPSAIRQRIMTSKRDGGHRDFASLAASACAPRQGYHSGIDIADAGSQDAFAKAVELRDALRPVLESGLSVAKMAAEAEARLATTSLPLKAKRSLRLVIDRILKNDARAGDFQNIQLYLTEALTWCGAEIQPSQEQAHSTTGPFSESALFEKACEDYEGMVAAIGQRPATRRVLDWLLKAGLHADRDALRMRFNRVWARYQDGARGEELIQDRRLNNGRDPLVILEEEERRAIQKLVVQTGCTTTACRIYAAKPDCREEVADAILKRRRSKHTLTPTLRAQVAVPAVLHKIHRSPTKAARESFINPRTLTFLNASGEEERILPGMLAERDDMSNNFIFWIKWPWGGDPCSDKYEVRIARGQNLLHIDVGSLRFLSMHMLVRLRDSYRADDIWDWVGRSYRDAGIPQIGERWERGIWTAKKLRGVEIEAGHTSQEERLGGITALGRRIITSQSPTTKIIENRFRYLQRVCTDIPGQIGASRGEMEQVNKLWTQCRLGHRDPRDYFLSFEDTVAALESKLQFVNAEPVEGTIYQGIPNELWLREGGDQRMTRLRPEQTYLFHRDRTLVTISKGHAMVRVSDPDGKRQAWYFHHPELWRHEGRRVALYYDKTCPEANPTLVHAEGRELNQVIGEATLIDGCPQFALGAAGAEDNEGRGKDGIIRRKGAEAAMRAEYRALGINHTIARGSYATDGRGGSVKVEKGREVRGIDCEGNLDRDTSSDRLRQKAIDSKRGGIDSYDEDAALLKIKQMEADAFQRGEILIHS